MLLAGREHPVNPGEELLGAMVGVENDRDAVGLRSRVDIVGSSDASEDRTELAFLADPLADEELGATVGELDHDGGVHLTRGGQRRVDGTGADAVDSREGKGICLGMVEKLLHLFAEEDACTKLFAHGCVGVGCVEC